MRLLRHADAFGDLNQLMCWGTDVNGREWRASDDLSRGHLIEHTIRLDVRDEMKACLAVTTAATRVQERMNDYLASAGIAYDCPHQVLGAEGTPVYVRGLHVETWEMIHGGRWGFYVRAARRVDRG